MRLAAVALLALAAVLAFARCTACRTCEVADPSGGPSCQQGCLDSENSCVPNGVAIHEGAACDGGVCRDGGCAP